MASVNAESPSESPVVRIQLRETLLHLYTLWLSLGRQQVEVLEGAES